MIDISNETAIAFRTEILLTATLRHPNIGGAALVCILVCKRNVSNPGKSFLTVCIIFKFWLLVCNGVNNRCFFSALSAFCVYPVFKVSCLCMFCRAYCGHVYAVNFIGCCWGRELTCLVLEWVAKGTLGDILADDALPLRWEDPLLAIAADLARGLGYLHSRRFFDEADHTFKECIIHRFASSATWLCAFVWKGGEFRFFRSRYFVLWAWGQELYAHVSLVGCVGALVYAVRARVLPPCLRTCCGAATLSRTTRCCRRSWRRK
jgi:hypothetical protein